VGERREEEGGRGGEREKEGERGGKRERIKGEEVAAGRKRKTGGREQIRQTLTLP